MAFILLPSCFYPTPSKLFALHFAYRRRVFCVGAQGFLRRRVSSLHRHSDPATSLVGTCYIGALPLKILILFDFEVGVR